MNSAIRVALVLLLAALAYPQSKKKPSTEWFYPDDTKAICSQTSEAPYSYAGLPNGTVAVDTTYCRPGFFIHRPQAIGLWRIGRVRKLYYRGKLFAIIGRGTCFSEEGDEAGCVQDFVVYDPDGGGKFSVVEDDPNDDLKGRGHFTFQIG